MRQEAIRETAAGTLPPLWRSDLRRNATLVVQSRRQTEARLVARATKDEAFRRALLDDARAAVASERGVALPAGVEYAVLEETDDVLHLVLPTRPHDGLTEADVGASAGVGLDEIARWAVEQQAPGLLEPDVAAAVVARAWRDEAFVEALRADAIGTLRSALGIQVDGVRRIEVFVETPTALALVLPQLGVGATAGPAWREDEDELMMNILASPCFQSHPDPCPAGSRISL